MSRRLTIDLTDEASCEIDRLMAVTGKATTTDLLRSALSVFRIIVDARSAGKAIRIGDDEILTLPWEDVK